MKNNNGRRSVAKKEQQKHAKPTGEATAGAAAEGNRRQLSRAATTKRATRAVLPHMGDAKNDFELAQLHVSVESSTAAKHFS